MQIKSIWIIIIVALLPLIYLAAIWNSIPAEVPLHFDAQFHANKIGNKSALWMICGGLAAVSILVYLLLQNIQRFDPKRRGKPASATFRKLSIVLVVFIAALNFITIIASVKGGSVFMHSLFPLLGIMFAFIGNYMNNIKPNYFAGYRLPWTLSDDNNWRKTHQLASKLWFACGLLIALISFFLPSSVMFYVFIGLMVIMILIPVIYSYRLFQATTS